MSPTLMDLAPSISLAAFILSIILFILIFSFNIQKIRPIDFCKISFTILPSLLSITFTFILYKLLIDQEKIDLENLAFFYLLESIFTIILLSIIYCFLKKILKSKKITNYFNRSIEIYTPIIATSCIYSFISENIQSGFSLLFIFGSLMILILKYSHQEHEQEQKPADAGDSTTSTKPKQIEESTSKPA